MASVLTGPAVSGPAFADTGEKKPTIVVEKSPNDLREYRAFTLDNGLRVVVVRDETTEKASASLDVAVGSGSDPKDRAGLAHFLEHMLFLGTKKYPDAGEYSRYIREHGGFNNAYTAFANTNYFFDVEAGHLEPALDRFAQFFVAPLFTPDLVDREKNAVHSEFSGKKREDGRRIWSARKRVFSQDHPMSQFATGNLETLEDREGSTVRDELLAFYETYYSANIMSLAVIGREPLDQLEAWVRERFDEVKNRDSRRQAFDQPLYEAADLPSRLDITPLKEQRFMSLNFPLPTIDEFQYTKPASYIGHILGHEGKGSLLSSLKAKGWVESLSAGGGIRNRKATTFDISVGLTEAGIDHVDDIVAEIFQAIRLVRESGVQEWMHEEDTLLSEIAFRFQEKSEPSSLVRSLASRLHDWEPAQLLTGPYRTSRFAPDHIRMVLDAMQPENLSLMVVAPGLDTDRTTRWFEAEYSITPIAEAVVERWKSVTLNPDITLPTPNAFIPKDLTLKTGGAPVPEQLQNEEGFEFWHRTDASFNVPKANFYASVRSPQSTGSARNTILTQLYTRVVNENMNEFAYPAALAGLSFSLYRHVRGFSMRISGYADGQREMLERLIAALRNPVVEPELFARLQNELVREIRAAAKEPPYEQTIGEVRRFLTHPYYSPEERIEITEALTPADLEAFVPRLLEAVDVLVLSHGNIDTKEATARASLVRKAFVEPAKPATVGKPGIIKLDEKGAFQNAMAIEHNDSSFSMYVQGQTQTRAERARFSMLSQMMSQPFYEELRTKRQLGYYVFATTMTMVEVPAMLLSLQSPGAGPKKLDANVREFLDAFEDSLAAMSDADFERHREAVLTRVEEQDKRLSERTNRYWSELDMQEFGFDTQQQYAAAVRAIKREDIVALFKRLFVAGTAGRITVYNEGAVARDADDADAIAGEVLTDKDAFKQGRDMFQAR